MKQLITTIEQSGWTGLILYGLMFLLVLLFIELHDKKQNKIFVNGRWIENDFDPVGFRIFFAGCLFVGSVGLFFIVKMFVL